MEDSLLAPFDTDFINLQVGMYTDTCSGFSKNKNIVEG